MLTCIFCHWSLHLKYQHCTVLQVSYLSSIMSVMDCKEGVKHKINDRSNVRSFEEQGFNWMLPSAKNTAYVDLSRLTVVHWWRPGGHGNLHMSFYHFLFSGSCQKDTNKLSLKLTGQGHWFTWRLREKRQMVKYDSDLNENYLMNFNTIPHLFFLSVD